MIPSNAREEDETARAAARGDGAAMDRLVRVISPRMKAQLGAYGLDPQERADALQNALLKVLRHLGTFREDAQLSTWLYRLTENEALMLLRSRRRTTRLVTGVALEDLGRAPAIHRSSEPDAALCAARSAAWVREEIERLPAHHRAVIVAHYLDELDLEESSQRLGVSTSAVKGRLMRARRSMRAARARLTEGRQSPWRS